MQGNNSGVTERQALAATGKLPLIWEALGAEDRALLADALSALLAERSRAFRIAHDLAIAQRRPPPTIDEFELSEILRLQRTVAGDVAR